MQRKAPFESYRGTDPYLFISYAHKDSDRVFPIILALRDRGWRMWYDEGIDPGNEWTAFIETALIKARQVLSFISPNAVESLNVRQEINLAVDDRRQLLAVHLEETELKYGLRLRMSAFQAVMKHRIDSDEEFFRALERGLDPACRDGAPSGVGPIARETRPKASPQNQSARRGLSRVAFVLAGLAIVAGIAVALAFFAAREPSATDAQTASEPTTAPAPTTASTTTAAQTTTAAPAKPEKPSSALPAGFVSLPGGTVTLGAPAREAESADNELLHQVTIRPFAIMKHELTQADYSAVTGANPSEFTGKTLPVERVSWYEALAYCNKRSLAEGRAPAYRVEGSSDPAEWGAVPKANDYAWDRAECDFDANGYRLPTEAEWEYACRARTRTPFYAGETLSSAEANIDGRTPYASGSAGEYRGKTVPVGTFAANAFSLHDMSGNVWEWCWDWFGPYEDGTNPVGAKDGVNRVLRGGSWDTTAGFARSARRGGAPPATRGNDLGIRLVVSR